MGTRKPLTDRAIKSLKPNGKKQRLRDGLVRGFGYRMTPAGSGSYYFQYTFNGKRREISIVHKTLITARDMATRYRLLVKDGIDPLLVAERRREEEEADRIEREAKAKEPTIAELMDSYLKGLSKRSAKNRRSKLKPFRKAFGDRKVRSVSAVEIMDVVNSHSGDASRNSAFWSMNVVLNRVEYGKLAGWDNPLRKVDKKYRPQYEGTRERDLNPDEIKKVWWACEGVNRHASPIIRLLLLTGQRIEEVAGLRWSEINMEDQTWTLPPERIKTGKKRKHSHIVPLSELAVEIIRSQPITGDMIFPGRSGKKPYTADAIIRFKQKIVEDTGMKDFQCRDIRRTVKTQMIHAGIYKEVTDKIQNHSSTDLSSRHYDRHEYLKEKTQALDKWERELKRIIGQPIEDNVVHLSA